MANYLSNAIPTIEGVKSEVKYRGDVISEEHSCLKNMFYPLDNIYTVEQQYNEILSVNAKYTSL